MHRKRKNREGSPVRGRQRLEYAGTNPGTLGGPRSWKSKEGPSLRAFSGAWPY